MRVCDLHILDACVLATSLQVFTNLRLIRTDDYIEITDEISHMHHRWCPDCR